MSTYYREADVSRHSSHGRRTKLTESCRKESKMLDSAAWLTAAYFEYEPHASSRLQLRKRPELVVTIPR
jgi:hypothetical protein